MMLTTTTTTTVGRSPHLRSFQSLVPWFPAPLSLSVSLYLCLSISVCLASLLPSFSLCVCVCVLRTSRSVAVHNIMYCMCVLCVYGMCEYVSTVYVCVSSRPLLCSKLNALTPLKPCFKPCFRPWCRSQWRHGHCGMARRKQGKAMKSSTSDEYVIYGAYKKCCVVREIIPLFHLPIEREKLGNLRQQTIIGFACATVRPRGYFHFLASLNACSLQCRGMYHPLNLRERECGEKPVSGYNIGSEDSVDETAYLGVISYTYNTMPERGNSTSLIVPLRLAHNTTATAVVESSPLLALTTNCRQDAVLRTRSLERARNQQRLCGRGGFLRDIRLFDAKS